MTIIITDDDVKRLMSMPDCIDAMRIAFRDLAEGSAVNRPRMRYLATHSDTERRYMANVHVGAVPSLKTAVVRAGSQILKPPSADNDRRLYDNPSMFNWGIVILYSTETAEPLALMHEFQLSGMRVGATTAVAVDAMARPDAEIMALFGTGKQARRALEAILCVRKLKTVRVISPNAEHCAAFVRDMAQPGLDLVAMTDAAQAIAGADLVVSCTNALKPVIAGDLLEDGQFVVTIANSDATNKRTEADARVFERSSMVIVNDWESVVDNDQTELLDPMRAGVLREDQVCELGHVLSGKVPVRQPARDAVEPGSGVIYFKNNSGLAVQFAAAGGLIYAKAIKEGTNKVIPTEWLGSDLSAYYKAGFRPSP